MFVLQNIKDFIDNPMGKGSNAIPARSFVKNEFIRRYHALIANKDKKITLKIYKDGDDYYLHFLIPSEGKEKKNNYDVVLHFLSKNEDMGEDFSSDKNINRYLVKFFSNNPAFVFTFAYAFNINGMFVNELENKYHKVVLDSPPVKRNTAEVISYEKSIFFACYYLIENNKYLNKIILDAESTKFDRKRFESTIRTSDTIMMEIKKEERRIEKDKKNDKNESDRKPRLSRKADLSFGEVGAKADTATRETTSTGKNKTANKKILPKSKIKPRQSSSSRKR